MTANPPVLSPAVMLGLIARERERRLAVSNLGEFVKQAWHVMEPGVPFIPSWHIDLICEHLMAVSRGDIQRLLINIPPRHSKSTVVSVAWCCWEWINAPEEKFLCASYSGKLSIRDNVKARRLLQSPWYQERWGDVFQLSGDQNAKERFENTKTGYRIATSVGGTATGEGGSRLVLDDIHGAQAAQSDVMRESDLEWFDQVWSTRLNNPKEDAMVTVMQRLHEKDASGHILEDLGGWEHLCVPAEWEGKKRRTILGPYDPRKEIGELICPDRFGPEEIQRLKQQLGTYGASGQLQQDPVPSGGGILQTDAFKMWPADVACPPFEFLLQSYDTAFTEDEENDPTACTVWACFKHLGVRGAMLVDAWDEHLSYPQLRTRVIEDRSKAYRGNAISSMGSGQPRRADRIIVEKKASGQSLIQDLQLAKAPVLGYNPGTADKKARAHLSAPTLELGVLWIPESAKNRGQFVSWAAPFLRQLKKFPVVDADDYVDTFTQAILYLKGSGWLELPEYKDDTPPPAPRTHINPYAQ